MKIAVAGATGRLGRHVVAVLEEQGHDVVPMARSLDVDVITGDGLDAALAGVESIVDAATGPSPDKDEAAAFFAASTQNLQRAGDRAGVKEIVVVSIVGIDDFVGGFLAAKLVHEQAMLDGQVPVRMVRATQFHEFIGQVVDWGRQGEAYHVQRMRTQPVGCRALAEVIGGVVGSGAGPTIEVGGPRAEELTRLAELWVAKQGGGRIELADNPDDPDAERTASGELLPGRQAVLVGPTYDEWLDSAS